MIPSSSSLIFFLGVLSGCMVNSSPHPPVGQATGCMYVSSSIYRATDVFPSGFTAVDPIGEGAEFVVPSPTATGHRFSRSKPCLSNALYPEEYFNYKPLKY